MSSFRDSVALSQDLTGFDPGGRSLQEYTLAGKKLKRASLSGVNLRKADLSESDLASAELIGADLHNAQLFYAELLQAELENADFSEANLEGAKMSTPDVLDVNLDGADVHGETCWFIASDLFEEADEVESEDLEGQPAKILNKVVTAGLDPKNGETLGHVCTEDEAEAEEFPENDNWYICREEPHIRLSSDYVGADVCF
jgi:hypothetical protein